MGIRLAVDRPMIHIAVPVELRPEHQRNFHSTGLRTGRKISGAQCSAELAVIPGECFGLLPNWLSAAARIFHDNAHAGSLDVLAHFSQDPHSRIVHLHNCTHSLSWRKTKHSDATRVRYRIAIQRDHVELMTR